MSLSSFAEGIPFLLDGAAEATGEIVKYGIFNIGLTESMLGSVLNPPVLLMTIATIVIGGIIAGVIAGFIVKEIGKRMHDADVQWITADISGQDVLYQFDHAKTHNISHLHNLTMNVTGFSHVGRFNLADWKND